MVSKRLWTVGALTCALALGFIIPHAIGQEFPVQGNYAPGSAPGGAAGGDLSGAYPNPTVASLVNASSALTMGGTLTLGANTLALAGGNVSGAPTWGSNQAITLSTSSQPNVTSLGTLSGLTVSGVTLHNGTITTTNAYNTPIDVTATVTPGANHDAYGAYIHPTLTEAASGTHVHFSSLYLDPPVVSAGGGAITDANTLYISGAPTSNATTNLALYVDGSSANSRIKGSLLVGNKTLPLTTLEVASSSSPQLTVSNTATNSVTNNAGLQFYCQNSSAAYTSFGYLQTTSTGVTAGAENGSMIFGVVGGGSLATRLTLAATASTGGTLTLADAVNVAVGTSTGTLLGTSTSQKLGFFGQTPAANSLALTGTTTVEWNGEVGLNDAAGVLTVNAGSGTAPNGYMALNGLSVGNSTVSVSPNTIRWAGVSTGLSSAASGIVLVGNGSNGDTTGTINCTTILNSAVKAAATAGLGFNGTSSTANDVQFSRQGSAGIVGLVNANSLTSSTALRIYNTTDAAGGAPTNAEWLEASWSGNVCEFWTNKSGSGSNRSLELGSGSTGFLKILNTGTVNLHSNGSALAQNATDGFTHLPSCLTGTPSGTPTTYTGAVPFVVGGNNSLFMYVNSAWSRVLSVALFNRVTAQSAANSNITQVTTPASDTSYEISMNMNVTAATSLSTSLNCDYTDESSTARTMIFPTTSLSGAFLAGGLVTGTGAFETPVMHVRSKASTTVTLYTATGTFTSVTYTAEGKIVATK